MSSQHRPPAVRTLLVSSGNLATSAVTNLADGDALVSASRSPGSMEAP